jgi:hypothetical protein
MNRFRKIFLGCVILMHSCGGPSKITEEVEGKYKFIYPSGQVEILSIQNNHSFIQVIYAKESDYVSNAKPLYENKSTWFTSGSEFEFNHWLAISYLGRNPDSILTQPEYYDSFHATWEAPTSNRKGQINVYIENGYVLKKVDK